MSAGTAATCRSSPIASLRCTSIAPRSAAKTFAAAMWLAQSSVSNRCSAGSSPASRRAPTALCSIERVPTSGCLPMPPPSGSPDASSSRATRSYIARGAGCAEAPYLPISVAARTNSCCPMSAAPCSVAYLTSIGGPCCFASSSARSHSPRCAYASRPSETLPPCTRSTAAPAPLRCSLYRTSTSFAYCGVAERASERAWSQRLPAM
mmetsp:Transcript_24440/g.72495  ORF Transcript_24440/g.72495 Transcript_24440/m.72495 type:complete len:207 (+) Transcript_24440:492-1112(+)